MAYYGFIANQDQTVESLSGIILLFTIYPAIAGIIGSLLMMAYPLTNKKMIEIEEHLVARRGEA